MKKVYKKLKYRAYHYVVLTVVAIAIPLGLLIYFQSGEEEQVESRMDHLSPVNSETAETQKTEPIIDNLISSKVDKAETIDTTTQLTYKVENPPSFFAHSDLDQIVQGIVEKAVQRGLPKEDLSISLVDLNQIKCCAYASYQDEQPRYPASVVKLFWLIALFHQIEAQYINPEEVSHEDLVNMIRYSTNESASHVLDKLTNTQSQTANLPDKELSEWVEKRSWVNRFFKDVFGEINIKQKTFSASYPNPGSAIGPDYQIFFLKPDSTLISKNEVTTKQMMRLLVDIDQGKAIPTNYIDTVKELLKRDLNLSDSQNSSYNSIKSFLGEGLPSDTEFYSKMGVTSNHRNDGAIIRSPDGTIAYVLVIFGDNTAFYQDHNFFPSISQFVYEEMTKLSSSKLSSSKLSNLIKLSL